MSGGHFNYAGANLGWVARDIEEVIYNNASTELDQWGGYKGHGFSEATIQKLKQGAKALRVAEVYERRIDWLLSGDDSEEAFLRRLESDLGKLEEVDNDANKLFG